MPGVAAAYVVNGIVDLFSIYQLELRRYCHPEMFRIVIAERVGPVFFVSGHIEDILQVVFVDSTSKNFINSLFSQQRILYRGLAFPLPGSGKCKVVGNGQKSFNFNGMIDEVRVNNISMSSDWIKLCFMNEKAQDALVRW